MYYNSKYEFDVALSEASYDWDKGYGKTAPLNRLTIQFMLDGYMIIEGKVQEAGFDKEVKKVDMVISSIYKLGEVFTKEEVRANNKGASESTINRALDFLKSKEKIRPMGTGRNAKWMRINIDESGDFKNKQASIFDYLEF